MNLESMSDHFNSTVQLSGLTVLVGPNNSGKSQTLRDILTALTNPTPTLKLVREVVDNPPIAMDDYLRGVRRTPNKTNPTNTVYSAMNSNLNGAHSPEYDRSTVEAQFNNLNTDWIKTVFGQFRVAFLDAGSRLTVAQSGPGYNASVDPAQTLLQHLFVMPEARERLDDAFFETFGLRIRLDITGMTTFALRVAEDFGEIPEDPMAAQPIMSKFSLLDDQGDGYRSFVGVVLSILVTRNRVILLDEPEAFLHPEQARRLGRWIALEVERNGGNVVVATHNSHFLQGLLSAGSPLRLVRLNRQTDGTRFVEMDNETVSNLTRSPLLSAQRVLESVFHTGTVICEGDGDRMVYQRVALQDFDHTETLFINAQNKQTCSDVLNIVRSAGIRSCAIVDIDILNSAKDLASILVAAGADDVYCEEAEKIRATISEEINGRSENAVLSSVKSNLVELLEQIQRNEHDVRGLRSALGRIRSEASRWEAFKKNGLSELPSNLHVTLADTINTIALRFGVYIVHAGSLESWIKLEARKSKWPIAALTEVDAGRTTAILKQFVGAVVGVASHPLIPEEDIPRIADP